MSEEQKKPPKGLIVKLAETMGLVDRVPKRGRNAFHGYDYATESDIVDTVRGSLAARHVMLIPSKLVTTWSEVERKNGGKERLCTLESTWTFVDGDTGETLDIPMLSQGSDPLDKAFYKAITGAVKYVILKTFMVPTGDDPETEKDTTKPPEPKGAAAVKAAVNPHAKAIAEACEAAGVKADAMSAFVNGVLQGKKRGDMTADDVATVKKALAERQAK